MFSDGNTQRLYPNGDLMIQFTNGQREFHTKDYKVGVAAPRITEPESYISIVYIS